MNNNKTRATTIRINILYIIFSFFNKQTMIMFIFLKYLCYLMILHNINTDN